MKKFDMKDLSYETKLALVKDKKYPFERVIKLIDDKSYDDIILVALQREDATSEFLHKYIRHKCEDVRKKVASHPNISLDDLEILLDDLIESVSISALYNKKITNEMISKRINKLNYESLLSIQFAKALVSKQGIIELAEQLIIKEDTNEGELEEILDYVYECNDFSHADFKLILKKVIIYHSQCENIIFKHWKEFLVICEEDDFDIINELSKNILEKIFEEAWYDDGIIPRSFKLDRKFLI